jgi:hypothetical protein
MLRITTTFIIALLVVSGFLLAVLNDRYKILDTFQHKFFGVTTDTDGEACFAELKDRGIEYKHIGRMGKDICIIKDAVRIRNFENTRLSAAITVNCQTALNTAKWFEDINAKDVNHIGTYVCRKIAGSLVWSQHSFGNAIDITSINGASIKDDWSNDNDKGKYLRAAAETACNHFSNVLTPEYNKAHEDHFHLDNGPRYSSCDPEWYTFLRMKYRRLKTFF